MSDRLEDALRAAGSEHEPPAGWEDRVLAATIGTRAAAPAPAPARRRARWWMFAAPALAMAAAAAVYLWWPRGGAAPPQQLALAITVEHGGPIVRGTTAHPGDTLIVTATGGAAHRVVWVYRDDRELVTTCESSCRVPLTARGDYSVVAVSSDAPLPAPHGSLDEDVAAAAKLGAAYTIEPVAVR